MNISNYNIIIYLVNTDFIELLDYYDVSSMMSTCKELNNHEYLIRHKKIKNTIRYFNSYLSNKIFNTSKLIDWNDSFYGKLYYCQDNFITNIKSNDLVYPIVIGIDKYKRPFIVIKYRYDKSNEYNGLLVIHQKYTSNNNFWVKSLCIGPIFKNNGIGYMTENDRKFFIDNIESLISGNKVKVNTYSQVYKGDYEFDSNLSEYDLLEAYI
jgi:hypothetical protein